MTVFRDISFLWSMLHVVALFLLLFEPRYSWRKTIIIGFAGAGTLLVVNVLTMLRYGHGIIMSAAFFTCTIPSLLLFFVLSKYRDGRFFFLFCLTDTVSFWVMQMTNFMDRLTGDTYVVLLLSRLVIFPVVEILSWRYLRRPFLELQRKLDRGWWQFAAVGGVYYLLIMCTAVPVDVPMPDAAGVLRICLVLILMPLTYLTILHSLWRQMQLYEKNRHMELQRMDYEAICQKMELGRLYRHDMRHHLSTLDGLLQQGDTGDALKYVQALNGGLEEIMKPAQCANPAVNAVLTAYLVQAGNVGCTVDTRIHIPEELPFEDTDLCVILANPLENAIHACEALPENMRNIGLNMELTENGRLIVSVENACPQPMTFGPDGLPEKFHEDGHGLGLQSVRAVADKYGGLFRCQWEAGRFQLRVVLIPAAPAVPGKRRPGRVTVAVFGVLLGVLLLNCIPGLADTVENIPILGTVIRIVDLRTYAFLWKDAEVFAR